MCISKKKRIIYSNKRLINLIGEDKNTLNLEAKNVQNIKYTLASEDNETSHILGIDEQGNAYINAKEEDLATFSMLDNPYLNNIVLPKKLKKIGFRGFYNIGRAGNITSLDFRDTQLETLESGSLQSDASLKIYLPTTVTNINSRTFGSNTTVYYKGTAEGAPWGAKEVITEF